MNEHELLHLGGLDHLAPAYDPQPFGAVSDPLLQAETEQVRNREHIPQLGPNFVGYVVERFDALDAAMVKALKAWSYRPTTFVAIAAMQSDASGNIGRAVQANAAFLEPPPGWTMALHRLSIAVGGNNFGTPFNAAAAYWELRVNDELVDGGSLVAGAGSFPVVRSWGTRDAPHIRDGEVASLFVSGTAAFANKQVVVKAQGTSERQVEA